MHLSNLRNVVATGVGRYLINRKDWYATHPPDEPRPAEHPHVGEPRTLGNSIIRSWSWPCVLVFVRSWEESRSLGDQAIPRRLYLPDGRQVPTCRVLGTPDESLPPPVTAAGFASELLGGGYRCERHGQGLVELGTLGCLVQREGTFYALTNRHVAGTTGEPVYARVRGEAVRIGVSDGLAVTKQTLKSLFPDFGASHAFVNLDAGLVRLDDVSQWTSQVYGIGEIGEVFDATAATLTLDLLGLPVRAFGGTSGVLEGEIKALFFRYQSLGDFDYVSDVLIGPRAAVDGADPRRPARPSPETHPGDSGTFWFYDPPGTPKAAAPKKKGPDLHPADPPDRGLRARRLRPIAMQWGGQRMALPDGTKSAFALGTFVSTVCRALDVEILRTWSTGHDEYWGKLGHFAVGWKACDLVSGPLGALMKANQKNIGFGNDVLQKGSAFAMGRGGFVPLADVPDYVWIAASKFVKARNAEGPQHFADIDIPAIDGGPSMLEVCRKNPKKIVPPVWRDYFAGFAQAGCGPDEGALPFRVWQLWDLMVAALKKKDVKTFLAAGGVMAHYVGDASQPLHTSYLHHGRLPMLVKPKGKYPVAHGSAAFTAFKKTREAKIHGIYEERDARDRHARGSRSRRQGARAGEGQGRRQERLGRGPRDVRSHERRARAAVARHDHRRGRPRAERDRPRQAPLDEQEGPEGDRPLSRRERRDARAPLGERLEAGQRQGRPEIEAQDLHREGARETDPFADVRAGVDARPDGQEREVQAALRARQAVGGKRSASTTRSSFIPRLPFTRTTSPGCEPREQPLDERLDLGEMRRRRRRV